MHQNRSNMRKIKRIITLVLSLTILAGNATSVQAGFMEERSSQLSEKSTNEQVTYEFGSTWETYTLGLKVISSSTTLTLTMPSNNGKDLIQGTIYFIPLSGGSSINLGFGNYAMETYNVDLSSIPAGGYMIKIGGVAVGESDYAKVTCKLN